MKATTLRKRLEAGKVVTLGEGEDMVHVWPDALLGRNKRVYIMEYGHDRTGENVEDGMFFFVYEDMEHHLSLLGLVEDEV